MMIKFHLTTLTFAIINTICCSQDSLVVDPDVYGMKLHYGFIIPHSEELEQFTKRKPFGVQVEWSKLRNSEKSWKNCNCYAQTGLAMTYFNYRNPDKLGSSFNLIYFAEPYLNYRSRTFFSFRTGAGISYLTKVYDEEKNPENTFFSTPISFLILLNVNVNYSITPKMTLTGSINYNHISNGGMKQPNRGMNFPTASLGINYMPERPYLPRRPKVQNDNGDISGYIRLYGTLPGVAAMNGKPEVRKLLIGTTVGGLYQFSNLNAINAGVEFASDESIKEKAVRAGEDFNKYTIGALIGHNLIFGRFIFNQQMGLYLYRPFPSNTKKVYQRYELLYKLTDKFHFGTSLKVHGHVAENFDIRLGISF